MGWCIIIAAIIPLLTKSSLNDYSGAYLPSTSITASYLLGRKLLVVNFS